MSQRREAHTLLLSCFPGPTTRMHGARRLPPPSHHHGCRGPGRVVAEVLDDRPERDTDQAEPCRSSGRWRGETSGYVATPPR